MKIYLLPLVFLFLFIFNTAEATTVLRSGSAISVANDQAVEANFYAWGNSVSISGEMLGDVIVAGGTVAINGFVEDDVFALGGTVSVSGKIDNDVRVIGGDVIIEGTILGNLSVVGGRVKLLSNAQVGGDVVLYATDVLLEGEIKGKVMGTASTLRLNGAIDNLVDVNVNSLTVGERAFLSEGITYVSQSEMVRAMNATIKGEVVRNDPVREVNSISFLQSVISIILMILFGTLCLYLILKTKLLILASKVTQLQMWKPALIGIAVFISTPFMIGLLFASMLGTFVGTLLLLLLLILILVAVLMLPIVLGSFLSFIRKCNITEKFILWTFGGALVLLILIMIPYLGVILIVVTFFITFGMLIQEIFEWIIEGKA
jgi:cytoskeletal protein CcmA (bactofilin family)